MATKEGVGVTGASVEETSKKKKQTTTELDGRLAKGLATKLEHGLDGIESCVNVLELGEAIAASGAKEVAHELVSQVAEAIRGELATLQETFMGQLRRVEEKVESLKGDVILFSSGSRRDKGKRIVEDDKNGEEASVQPRVKNGAYGKDKTQSKGDSRNSEGKSRKPFSCFLCEGPHMARNCPQRQKLNAIIANMGEESAPIGRIGAMVMSKSAHLANMRLLNAAEVEDDEPEEGASSKAEGTSIKPKGSMMVVNGEVNEAPTRFLVDTGALHKFLAKEEAKALGVKFTKVDGGMKAINSASTPICGKAWRVLVLLGKWKGKLDFLVVEMDDEDVVVGMEFLDKVRPFTFGDGIMTITHKGSKHDIKLARVEEDGAKISSLKAWWAPRHRRQGAVPGRTKVTPMLGTRHQREF
uniref:Uncharacterized protein n=1 Tax=Chenopodium quinoa TaxID=63459 RepID=A0A803MRW6_CHEQI